MNGKPESIQLPLVWIGADDVPIALANSFVAQFEQDEIILTVGQLVPPMLVGNQEEQIEQANKIAFVPIKVIGRLAFTRQRAGQLAAALNEILAKYDTAHKGEG